MAQQVSEFDLFSAKLIQVGQVEESKKAQEELKNREKEARQQMRNLEKARQLLHMGSSIKLMESHGISWSRQVYCTK